MPLGEPDELLTDIGEYALHSITMDLFNSEQREIGDDCATYPLPGGDIQLINTDRLALNVEHYNRARLCVAQTLSDIVCMGGRPEFFLVALTLPRDTRVHTFKQLMTDLRDELTRYGTRLIGGDTKEGPEFHMVGIGLGRTSRQNLVRRTGAEPGMLVGVTSTGTRPWGCRWAHAVINYFELTVAEEIRELCRREDEIITLPVEESAGIIATGHVRAGLDLSDGLGGGLRILARESGCGFRIRRDLLRSLVDPRLEPVADGLGLPIECFAISPGYNWENMFVIDPGAEAQVVAAADEAGGLFTVIGTCSDDPAIAVDEVAVPPDSVPADQKFATSYRWEDRFTAWREDCKVVLGGEQ